MEKRILVCNRCGAVVVDRDLKIKWGNSFFVHKFFIFLEIDYDTIDLCPNCTRDLLAWLGYKDKKH